MRILHLVSYSLYSGPLPPTVGLALAQRERGHEVFVAYDTKRGAFNDFEEPAAPRLDGLGLDPPLSLCLSAKSSVGELVRDRRALSRFVRDGGVDVVHVHLSHDHALAVAAKAHKRATLVRTFHAARSLVPRFGQRWLNRRLDGAITRCEPHRDAYCAMMGVEPEQVPVIPSGVDTDQFTPAGLERRARARSRLGLPARGRIICHVALIEGRGQEELAGALVRVNSPLLHVLYVGRGRDEDALALLVKGIGLEGKAHFAGYLQGPALLDAYAAADAAFLARPGNDASARAVLEAMASGLPVLAVDADALGELVTEDVGYPIPEARPGPIAEAIERWLCDEGADTKGRAARELVVAERSFGREAERTLAYYEARLGR